MNTIYTKVALQAYKHLDSKIAKYKLLIYGKGMSAYKRPAHVFEQCAEIAELQFQKQTLIELKKHMDLVLSKISPLHMKIIVYGYSEYDVYRPYARKMKTRTFSQERRQQVLDQNIDYMTDRLERFGLDEEWWEKEGLRVPWLKKLYDKQLAKVERAKVGRIDAAVPCNA